MLASDETALRSFCARIIGWDDERAGAVEHAVRSLKLAMDQCMALVLLGCEDLVPIAHALRRRMRGDWQPFIIADPRRGKALATVRSPANHMNGLEALQAARGGSLCVRAARLPKDFSSVVRQMRDAMIALPRDPENSVQLIVCADARFDVHPFITLPAPILVPSLVTRSQELPRIIDEYARDASAELRAPKNIFTEADRQWVLANAPRNHGEIEKATLRLVALRASKNIPRAAERLGMSPVSLSRWLDRRRPLPSDLEQIFDDFVLTPEERVVFERELEASFAEEEAGLLVDAADVIADLRSRR